MAGQQSNQKTPPPAHEKQDDHDQRFKTLVMEFLAALFRLFWPEFARLFDFRRIEWLDKEAFPDPPTGRRKVLDVVGKLRLRKRLEIRPGETVDSLLAIIHVEVEASESVVSTRQDMFKYFAWLRQKHDLLILPVALYLNVGMDGIGIDTYSENFGPLEVLRYNFLYVGLSALDGREYLDGDSLLGVALSALMKVSHADRARHRALALKRIVASDENDYHKYLLAECVQAYLPLKDVEQREFETLLEAREFREVKTMAVTWFEQGVEKGIEQGVEKGIEQGIEKGIERGRKEGGLMFVSKVLAKRFGPLSRKTRERLANCSEDELANVLDRCYQVTKLREVFAE